MFRVFAALAISAALAAPLRAETYYAGGTGADFASAVVIVSDSEVDGVKAEYDWLGRHRAGWEIGTQAMTARGAKNYDVFEISKGAKRETVYFDITSFYGAY